MNQLWDDPERIVAFIGAIASIISILINIFQAIAFRNLKKAACSALQSSKNAFQSIYDCSNEISKALPVDQDRIISSISAHSERAKDQIENLFVNNLFD